MSELAPVSEPIPPERLTIVPANQATWDDLVAIFGTADAGRCQCQRFKVLTWIWRDSTQPERTAMLQAQTGCGDPDAPAASGWSASGARAQAAGPSSTAASGWSASGARAQAAGPSFAAATSGLVAYVDDQPAGWVAVEPRTAYPKLRTSRVPWSGRDEDKDDDGVWAVTCFVVRKGYRGGGLTYPLAQATVGFARQRGARALEAYPMITRSGQVITWGELHVGARQVFEDAGFVEVSHPTLRRVVMRIDF